MGTKACQRQALYLRPINLSLTPWLDPDLNERDAIRAAVHHLEADALTAWPVSRRVNRADEEGEPLVAEIQL